MSLVWGMEANQGGASPWEENIKHHVCGQMNVSRFSNLTLRPTLLPWSLFNHFKLLYLLHRYTLKKYSAHQKINIMFSIKSNLNAYDILLSLSNCSSRDYKETHWLNWYLAEWYLWLNYIKKFNLYGFNLVNVNLLLQ